MRTNRIIFVLLFCVTAASISGCNNVGTGSLVTTGGTNTTDQGVSVGNSNVVLNQVVPDSISPTSIVDLIGDGSGAFSSYCIPQSGTTNSSTTPTVCACNFTYNSIIQPSPVDKPVIYHDANMLRCSYGDAPPDATTIQVSIHLTNSDSYSNTVLFNITNGGGNLNLTDPNSFTQALRFQCRQHVNTITYLFDQTIYDPIQSEDPHLSYGLDFYSINLGDSIAAFLQAFQANTGLFTWECPTVLNPIASLATKTARDNFELRNNLSFAIYRKGPLANTSIPTGNGNSMIDSANLIFDPNSPNPVQPSSTFYLATGSAGVFIVPVNAYNAPGSITTDSQPLGFGASPIPQTNGTETCPTSTAIPSGYHWVKVWLFRASLPSRQAAVPDPNQGQNLLTVQSIMCNPGDWASTAGGPQQPVFQACPLDTFDQTGTASLAITAVDNGTRFLADRVLGNNQCVILDNQSGRLCADTLGNPIPGPGCNQNGADNWWAWNMNLTTAPTTATAGLAQLACNQVPAFDPTNSCSAGFPAIPQPDPASPFNSKLTTRSLDDSSPRYDFLFVVSPITINLIDMQNPTPGSPALPYQPFRFYTRSDCQSGNPSQPNGPTDCLSTNAINTYGLKLHDVGSNGDPPGGDPNNPVVFPVCAIQPDQ